MSYRPGRRAAWRLRALALSPLWDRCQMPNCLATCTHYTAERTPSQGTEWHACPPTPILLTDARVSPMRSVHAPIPACPHTDSPRLSRIVHTYPRCMSMDRKAHTSSSVDGRKRVPECGLKQMRLICGHRYQ